MTGWKGDPWRIVQEIKIWSYNQIVCTKQNPSKRKKYKKISGLLRYKLIPARRLDLVLINKKKRTCHLMYFAIPVDHWENERKRKDKQIFEPCLRLLKELWNIRATVIQIVFGALGTLPKSLEKNWKNWKSEENSRPSKRLYCQDWLEHSEESWRFKETYYHSYSSERAPANACVKNSIIIIIMMMMIILEGLRL